MDNNRTLHGDGEIFIVRKDTGQVLRGYVER